jgi:uncharacterized protein (TIGR02145 family)
MNYFEMSRKFVCCVAMPLALMFAACSSDDGPTAGGSAEETGVYAHLENVSIHGKARMAKALGGDGASEGRIVVTGLEKGSVVSLYQLDPETFALSDSSITEVIGDEGAFAFQNVTLECPYVMIYATRPGSESAYPYSVLADVRDADEISIDILTHLEALRALYLLQSGTSFDLAKKQARAEALTAFGMYGIADDIRVADTLEYTAMISSLMGVLPTSIYSIYSISLPWPWENSNMNKLFTAVAERGAFLNIDSELDESFVDIVSQQVDKLRMYFSVPATAYQKLGDDWARDYQVRLRMVEFYAGMLAAAFDAGRCDQEHEGIVFDIPRWAEDHMAAYDLVCRSGNWNLVHKELDHSMGTMTDSRDGRVYKTVTIDIDGVSRTWMAEDLHYDGAEDALCSEDGCSYNLLVAAGLDSSDFIINYEYESYEACVDYWHEGNTEPYGGTEAYCEKSMSDPWVQLDRTKVDVSDTAKYQGVCPDGWRLPNPRDWESLLSVVQTELDMDGSPSALYLYDIPPFGNPVGMGLTSGYSIMWLGHSPDFIPSPSQGLLTIVGATFVTAPGTAEVGDNYDNWIDVVYQVYIGGRGLEFSDGNSQNPVRCVKN